MLFSDDILEKMKRNEPSFGKEIALADKLDSMQQGKIVTGVVNLLATLSVDVTTGSATFSMFGPVGAPFKFEIVDVLIQPRGDSTNGTITIKQGANAITDAMVCAADKTMVRPATIDNAYSTVPKNGNIVVVCAGDTVGNTIALVSLLVIAKD